MAVVELEDTLQSDRPSGDEPTQRPSSPPPSSGPSGADVEDPTLPADSLPPGAGDFADLRHVSRDNYEIGHEIARGGMGRIVAARDRRAGRPIVIKEVRADLLGLLGASDREALVRRFKREAMLTARLQHPSVVPVYEIGRFDDTPFIAMKRVDGTPLLDLLEDAKTLADRLALLPRLIAVAEAIAYAHAEGVVHRDLKPANILVGSYGETVVIDWGLAKLAGEADEAIDSVPPVPGDVETVAGAVFGTPAYMPPEQASGEPVGPAADVYAIGAILYHLLCGRAPYSGESIADPNELVSRVRDRPPRPIREVAADAPADLVSIVEKAMARDPNDRYASAGELASDLGAFQRGQLVEVHDYSTWELIRRWVARRRALVLTALVLTVAGVGATSWFVVQTLAARDQARREEARAAAQLHSAMETTYERGKRELLVDRRRAITSLATAYRHLDDPLLARELGEALLGLEGFRGELDRPRDAVEDINLSPDGSHIAVVSSGEVKLYEIASSKVILSATGKRPRFADGGKLLLTEEVDGLIVWDVHRGVRLDKIDLPLTPRAYVAINEHADLVFFISDMASDRGVVYSLNERRRLFEIDIETVYIGSVRISDDGQRIFLGRPNATLYDRSGAILAQTKSFELEANTTLSADGRLVAAQKGRQVAVHSSETGELVAQLRSIGPGADGILLSDDGTMLMVVAPGSVCVWRLEDGKQLGCHASPDAGPQVASTRNFERVVTTSTTGLVEVWEGHTGRVRTVFAAHSDGAPDVEISADGSLIATGGLDGAVRLWDGSTDLVEVVIERPGASDLLSDNSDLVVLASKTRLEVWNPDAPDSPIAKLEIDEPARGYGAISARAEIAVWAGHGWEPRSGRRLAAIPGWDDLHAIAIDPAGEIVVGCGLDGYLRAYDPRTGVERWRLELAGPIGMHTANPSTTRAVATLCSPTFDPSGQWVVVRTPGVDLVVDPETGGVLHVLDHRERGSTLDYIAVFFGPDKYAAADGAAIFLWDLSNGARLETFSGSARGLASHPDSGRLLLPLVEANFIYDTRTKQRRRIATASEARGGASFSRDGELVAIGGMGAYVDLHDVTSGRLVARRAPGGPIRRLFFSRGGRLVVMTPDRTLVWSLPVERRDADEVDRAVARGLGADP